MKTVNIYFSDVDDRYYSSAYDAITAARDYWMHLTYNERRNYCENSDRVEHKYIDRMTLDVSDELADQISKCNPITSGARGDQRPYSKRVDDLDKLVQQSAELREIISEHDFDDDRCVYDLERDIIADADTMIIAAADKLDNAYRVYRDAPIWIDARTVRELRVDIETADDEIESLYLSARVDAPGNLRIEDVDDDYSIDGDLAERVIDLLQLGWPDVVNAMDAEIREDLNSKLAPCGVLRFLSEYLDAHERKYNEAFTID